MKYAAILIFLVSGLTLNAQQNLEYWMSDSSKIYEISEVDQAAYFPGGDRGFENYVRDNLRYPKQVVRMKIAGTVYVECIIEADGTVNVISIRRGIGGGADGESLKFIKSMPKWDPAKKNSVAVRQRKILRIIFDLKKIEALRNK